MGVSNVTVLDYVDDMAALMAASDVAICKSGGLTVTECLCAQVPMILMGKAYGQEKVNVQMLTSLGAAMHVTTARELLDALRRVARNPKASEPCSSTEASAAPRCGPRRRRRHAAPDRRAEEPPPMRATASASCISTGEQAAHIR